MFFPKLKVAGYLLAAVFSFSLPSFASSVSAAAYCGFGSGLISASSSTPGAGVQATDNDSCNSLSISDYGILKLYSWSISSSAQEQSSTSSAFDIYFNLFDATLGPNAPLTINVPIQYEFTLDTLASQSAARFDLTSNDPQQHYLAYQSGATNVCPSPGPSAPACNARYMGVFNIPLAVTINGAANLFHLAATTYSSNGVVDAYHTITLGNTMIPLSTTYRYDSNIGNPLNFQPSASVSTVPEPASAAIALAGIAMLLVWSRRRAAGSAFDPHLR